ncbi:MAG: hypothetical protein HFJ33_00215 [Clostridia bacterium]|nr:hypothetical protein [Clostridia bacterium]
MFIYNIKINGSKTFKNFFIGVVILVIMIVGIVSFRVFQGASNSPKVSSCLPQNKVTKLTTTNYSTILKTVHENIDDYVGIQINFIGYVYRVMDLTETQFVLARNMIVSSDFQSVVVGFLCEHENAKNFEDGSWVEITGKITKGNYHGDMPIVKVTEMKKVNKPNDEFVYPPDESYIPTSGVL